MMSPLETSATPAATPTATATPITTIVDIIKPSRKCFSFLKYINTLAIIVLSYYVFSLSSQLEVVTNELSEEKVLITELIDEVQNSQQDQIDQLDQKVQQTETFSVLHLAGTFVLIASLITMFHITMHVRNFHEPIVQRKILAILWMSPVYALTSFFSLVLPSFEAYMAILKDFYEAYVIYTFLSFLIAVLGRGRRQVVVDLLANHADHLAKPYRWLNYFFHPHPDESPAAKASAVLMECQILAMQFVFLRPITSIASFVVVEIAKMQEQRDPTMASNGTISGSNATAFFGNATSVDSSSTTEAQAEQMLSYFSSPQFWIAMIQNISVFFAFAGLLKFYHAVQSELVWCQPFPKFLCIKGVVFMTFWQGLLINITVSLKSGGDWEDPTGGDDPREKALQIQNVLICLEMLFFSIAHWCIFPVEEWEEGYSRKHYENPGMGFRDFASDIGEIMSSRKQVVQRRKAVDGDYIDVRHDTLRHDTKILPALEVEQGKLS